MYFKLAIKVLIGLFLIIGFLLTTIDLFPPCAHCVNEKTIPKELPKKDVPKQEFLDQQLTEAVKNNDPDKVIYYLQRGANPNTLQGPYKNAPLHHAAHNNNMNITKILLSYGANVRIKDRSGLTPMHYAWFYKSREVQRFLYHVLCSTPITHSTAPSQPSLC